MGNGFSASACKEKNDELNGIPPERRSPIVGDDALDSLPVSAIDDDGSQSFADKYENSLSVHSQSYESALPPQPQEHHHQQQPYESALPPGPPVISEHHRLSVSEHQHPYESALPPPHHQMSDHRLSEVA